MNCSYPTKSVLVIEDNSNDVFLLRHALEKIDPTLDVLTLSSGELALNYLLGQGEYRHQNRHPLPCLIFLDLHIPRTSGFEILQRIKKEPGLKRTPVVITSGSRQPEDVDRAYDLGANLYLTKKDDFAAMSESVKSIVTLFLSDSAARRLPSSAALTT